MLKEMTDLWVPVSIRFLIFSPYVFSRAVWSSMIYFTWPGTFFILASDCGCIKSMRLKDCGESSWLLFLFVTGLLLFCYVKFCIFASNLS